MNLLAAVKEFLAPLSRRRARERRQKREQIDRGIDELLRIRDETRQREGPER